MASQTPNMNNAPPSAKRRRVEAANETLKKPFRSPMINRQQQTQPTSSTPSQGSPTGARTSFTKPPAPAPAPAPKAIPVTPLRPRHAPITPSHLTSSFTTPLLTNRTTQSTPIPPKHHRQPTPSSKHHQSASNAREEDDLITRIQASTKQINTHLDEIQKELDLIRQARRIEDASRRKRPGEEIDAELKELVAKWKGACRLAAEELFDLVKGRVESMGGGEAWRRSRKRNAYDDHDDGEGRGLKRMRDSDDEEHEEGEGEVEGDEEGREGQGKEGEGDEEGFTMLMMLRSLNIEPELLGWDEGEEKWKS